MTANAGPIKRCRIETRSITWEASLHPANCFREYSQRTSTELRFPFPVQRRGHMFNFDALRDVLTATCISDRFIARQDEIGKCRHTRGRDLPFVRCRTPALPRRFPFDVIGDPGKALYRRYAVESSISALLAPKAFAASLKGNLKKDKPKLKGLPNGGILGCRQIFSSTQTDMSGRSTMERMPMTSGRSMNC
jgi:hypothetical protein